MPYQLQTNAPHCFRPSGDVGYGVDVATGAVEDFSDNVPDGAEFVLLSVRDNNIHISVDGSDPTTTVAGVGILLNDGHVAWYSADTVRRMRAVGETGTGKIWFEFFVRGM